jgi:spore germination cell wall hydrolase CwlJ-like protein
LEWLILFKHLFKTTLFSLLLFTSKALVEDAPSAFSWELSCLAATIHQETTFNNLQQSRAVLDVILYRMHKKGMTACEVVLEKHQFTNMTMKKVQKVDLEGLTMLREVSMLEPVCRECTFFHDTSVSPEWQHKMKRVVKIDNMVFYRRK